MTGTYNVEKIRRERPENFTDSEWDKYIEFWNDPRNIARAAQNRQNQVKSTVISRQGSRSLARLRNEMEDMRKLEAMGTYTDDEINRLARGGKQRGHIAGVGRVLPARATTSLNMFSQFESGGASGSGGCGDKEEGADHQDDEDEDGDGDF
nr:F-box domain, leucine-rich repeat domain, L domain-like protein [Tanacetum cinerariifolium]